jgi:hypothetical protein
MDGQKQCGNQTVYSVNTLKKNIEKYNKHYIPRLKIFLSDYEKTRANIFSNILSEYDFIKSETVTFVASGLPYYMFDVLNTRYKTDEIDINFLNNSKKIVNKTDELFEVIILNSSALETKKQSSITKKIKLIDYSPFIRSTHHIVKEHFDNLSFEHYNKNVNFENIKEITKDSLIVIPYSEYLYILKELEIFNKGQYVLVFNQKEDEERRKINTAFCIEDLVEQCGFSQNIFAQKYDVCGVRMYVALGKV